MPKKVTPFCEMYHFLLEQTIHLKTVHAYTPKKLKHRRQEELSSLVAVPTNKSAVRFGAKLFSSAQMNTIFQLAFDHIDLPKDTV